MSYFCRENSTVISKLESVSIDGSGNNASSSSNNKSSTKALPNGNSSNYTTVNNHSPRQPQTNIRRNEDNVIRLPRGPDGSSGFLLKR